MNNRKYVVEEVPEDKLTRFDGYKGKVYYVHLKDFPYVPVWGSFGSKKHAQAVCDCYNLRDRKKVIK